MNPTTNKNIFSSFANAFKGIWVALKESRNLKIHVIAAVFATALSVYVGLSFAEWAILVFLMATIIFAELMNTAIEDIENVLRDKAGVPYEFTGKAKDIGAGAVLVLAIASLVVGYFIFIPKIL